MEMSLRSPLSRKKQHEGSVLRLPFNGLRSNLSATPSDTGTGKLGGSAAGVRGGEGGLGAAHVSPAVSPSRKGLEQQPTSPGPPPRGTTGWRGHEKLDVDTPAGALHGGRGNLQKCLTSHGSLRVQVRGWGHADHPGGRQTPSHVGAHSGLAVGRRQLPLAPFSGRGLGWRWGCSAQGTRVCPPRCLSAPGPPPPSP